MKNILSIITIICVSLNLTFAQSGSVGIGTNNPNPSAGLDVNFTDKGFLPPRLTSAQRDAIISPAPGLIIYNTTSNCLNVFTGIYWNELCGVQIIPPGYPTGYVHCSTPTVITEVTNPTTGKIWMDRNLGAGQVATSSSDAASFGDLYQWGRFADGHQCRNSTTTNTTSSTDSPGHNMFILPPSGPHDWRSPQNENLWQGVSGTNNPCPTGFRLPTQSEMEAERQTWSPNNAAGAFASPLKLPFAGYRFFGNGSISFSVSGYWTSTVGNPYSYYLEFGSSAYFVNSNRALGFSVRCIKN